MKLKKLSLSRETIMRLDEHEVSMIVGGEQPTSPDPSIVITRCTGHCYSAGWPDCTKF